MPRKARTHRMIRSLSIVIVVFALSCAGAGLAETQVSTLAGSGTTGVADGSARSASFMLPLGVAYDTESNLYIADAAAQRIREITRDGTVRTLAGSGAADPSGVWVPGGYADGNGAQARFNHPAAVAVGADARIYVADTYNHCVRVVSRDGTVSTFAGSPARVGTRTGPASIAEFIMPTGLTFDRAGNLYVVDVGIGGALRKISPDGVVSELRLPGSVQPAGGVAVIDGPSGQTIVLSDLSGLYVRRADGSTSFFRSEYFRVKCAARTAPGYVACDQPETLLREHRDIGTPGGIAAFNDHQIVYTDYRTNSVRYLDLRASTLRLVAGYALQDGSGRGGGAHDGDAATASFNTPFGIAVRPDGGIAIADGGTRRIRLIKAIDRSEPLRTSDLAQNATPTTAPRSIAYTGDITSWQGTEWGDSIAGRMERRLRRVKCSVCADAVSPVVWDSLQGGIAALSTVAKGRFDVVLLQLNMADVASFAHMDRQRAAATPGVWRGALVAALRRLDAATKARGSRLIVVVQPLPEDVGPTNALWGRAGATSFGVQGAISALRLAVVASGVEVADASRAFGSSENGAVPAPLFATDGAEFAAGGREALADTAAAAVATVARR